jgi:hypothetical protein
MKRYLIFVVGLLAFAGITAAQTKTERSLNVKLNYTGAGKVDDKHPIFVFLFDTPEFMQGNAMPIGSQSATAKDGAVAFTGVSAQTVYAVAAYDPNGAYDGMSGPPPAGSSLGLYSTEPGKPAPIALDAGKTAQITLPFDDSHKMQ